VVSSSSSVSKPNDQPLIVDVFTASTHGDFNKLRTFVEQHGASVSVPDVGGYYAIQWASLNNFHDIAHYLIQVHSILFPLFYLNGKLGVSFLLFEFKLVSASYGASFDFSSLSGYVSFKKLIFFRTLSEASL